MKIRELLEGFTSVLYHATDINSAIGIMRENKFILRPIPGTTVDRTEVTIENGRETFSTEQKDLKKYKYRMSFSRVFRNDFLVTENLNAVFEIDGRELGYNYKGTQHRYNRKANLLYYNEAEDRLLSKKKEIPNADRYIKKLHIFHPVKKIPNLLDDAIERVDYPIFIYREYKDFLNRRNGEKVN